MKRELLRKFFHIFFGTLILGTIYFLDTRMSFYLILIFTIFGFIIGYLIKKGLNLIFINKIISLVERENEKHFPGKAAVMFFIASLVILLLFQQEKMLAISILAVQVYADGFAAIFGKKFGSIKIYQKKTLAGTSSFFVISFFCLFLFFDPLTSIFLALIASVIEVLPIDDNLGVPIGLGFVIKILSFL